MSEFHRLVKSKVFMVDTAPTIYMEKIVQLETKKLEKLGYCVLYSTLSDEIRTMEMVDITPFRWLKLYCIYLGKRKVQDEALCERIRKVCKGNLIVFHK